MTATDSPGAAEGIAEDIEAPAARQATVGPLTGDPAIVGVPTFVVGSVMLGLAPPLRAGRCRSSSWPPASDS